jgi:hypothetical protein
MEGESEAEKQILVAVQSGDWADLESLSDDERRVGAGFVRRLALACITGAIKAPAGIRVRHAGIDGELDLAGLATSTAPGPALALEQCRIGKVQLSDSCWQRLSLAGSELAGLDADRLRLDGALDCSQVQVTAPTTLTLNGLHAGSTVSFSGLRAVDGQYVLALSFLNAEIGGQFGCTGARLRNVGGDALVIDEAVIKGGVFLRPEGNDRFEAEGRVSLLGAQIGGDFACAGASLRNAGNIALAAHGAVIKGNVFLRCSDSHRFEAEGIVGLSGAEISGQLNCSGARLLNKGGIALGADSVVIKGDVFLRSMGDQRFEAEGEVRLPGAKIGSHLDCSGASLKNENGHALLADGAVIMIDVALLPAGGHRFEAEGEVRICGTEIGGNLDCSGARLVNANGVALRADRAVIKGIVFLDPRDGHRFEAEGQVRFPGAAIGGQLACLGALLKNAGGIALSADGAVINGGVFLRPGGDHRFEAEGAVRLISAEIGTQLDCAGARLKNAGGIALGADGAIIKGSVFLTPDSAGRFEAEGEVRLFGAEISGQLACNGARLRNARGDALSAHGAVIQGDVLLRPEDGHRFEAEGIVAFYGARLGGGLEAIGQFAAVTAGMSGRCLNLRNAIIAGRAFVRLDDGAQGSRGVADMRGLRVAELDDADGIGWGDFPTATRPKGGTDPALAGVLLRLDGFRYERLAVSRGQARGLWHTRTKWLERQFLGARPSPADFYPQPYEQLAATLNAMGHPHDARRVAIKQRDLLRRSGSEHRINWPISWLFGKCLGYGYSPMRTTLTLAAYWLAGALTVNYLLAGEPPVLVKSATGVELVRDFRTLPAHEVAICETDSAELCVFASPPAASAPPNPITGVRPHPVVADLACDGIQSWLYALDLILPIIELHQDDKCEVRAEHWLWRTLHAAYSVMGWLVVAMAALTYAGVLRRDPR